MKGTIDIRRVITPARQRRVASRKRTLRRRSVRAARSVWSRLLSRVTEYRNFIVEVFLFDTGGTAPHWANSTKCNAARPVSASGAKERVDVLGTWESLCLLVHKITGIGRSRNTTSCVVYDVPVVAAIEPSGTGRVLTGKTETNRSGSDAGSLNRLIVAFESRETFSGGSL